MPLTQATSLPPLWRWKDLNLKPHQVLGQEFCTSSCPDSGRDAKTSTARIKPTGLTLRSRAHSDTTSTWMPPDFSRALKLLQTGSFWYQQLFSQTLRAQGKLILVLAGGGDEGTPRSAWSNWQGLGFVRFCLTAGHVPCDFTAAQDLPLKHAADMNSLMFISSEQALNYHLLQGTTHDRVL